MNRYKHMRIGLSRIWIAAVAAAAAALAAREALAVPYYENFQSPAPSTNVAADYPDFTFTAPASTDVTAGGVLRIVANSQGNALLDAADYGMPVAFDPIIVFADIGATDSNGNYNVGLQLGPIRLVFHPDHPGAAVRAEGSTDLFNNTNIGFTPADNVLHHFRAEISPFSNTVLFSITDGANPSNRYSGSFTTPSNIYGQVIGFTVAGGTGEYGLFDNLAIVPEPASLGLLATGALTLWGRRRREA